MVPVVNTGKPHESHIGFSGGGVVGGGSVVGGIVVTPGGSVVVTPGGDVVVVVVVGGAVVAITLGAGQANIPLFKPHHPAIDIPNPTIGSGGNPSTGLFVQ